MNLDVYIIQKHVGSPTFARHIRLFGPGQNTRESKRRPKKYYAAARALSGG